MLYSGYFTKLQVFLATYKLRWPNSTAKIANDLFVGSTYQKHWAAPNKKNMRFKATVVTAIDTARWPLSEHDQRQFAWYFDQWNVRITSQQRRMRFTCRSVVSLRIVARLNSQKMSIIWPWNLRPHCGLKMQDEHNTWSVQSMTVCRAKGHYRPYRPMSEIKVSSFTKASLLSIVKCLIENLHRSVERANKQSCPKATTALAMQARQDFTAEGCLSNQLRISR